ncbi:MAG TPA: CPBP family intramembrane glutamic endopeptidase [Vicinamibacterales bacterium]
MLLCSGFPTQLAIAATYVATGHKVVTATGGLATAYVVVVSLVDTVVVVGLVLTFLLAHGERPRDVLFGQARPTREVAAGLLLVPAALVIAGAVLLTTQRFAPWLHTVEHNPLQDVLQQPRDAWLFVFVVIFAGGVREEIQRAFILHRFGVWLGGTAVGLVVTSIAFGAGHLTQGADAAIATGLLGFLWGAVYLRRKSAVAPMVSHAGFDLLQIAQFLISR